METYYEKEIKHIKAQEWDRGWRWGLLAASLVWIVFIICLGVALLIKYS